MQKQLILFVLFHLFFTAGGLQAGEQLETGVDGKDEEVIAVLEILELMEMMDDVALLKDMEYLTEEDPNEPQK